MKNVIRHHITLEGIDGSGKSTFWNRLKSDNDFSSLYKDRSFIFDKSPFDKVIEREIRKRLSYKDNINPHQLFELFMSDNSVHAIDISKKLNSNPKDIIISDRYITSTFAYQSLDIPFNEIKNSFIASPIQVPGLIIFFDLNPKVSMERIANRSENKEIFEKLETLKTIKDNYVRAIEYMYKVTEGENETTVVEYINSNRDMDTVYNDAKNKIIEYINKYL